MEWIEVTGRTVDEAKERALDELGVHESELEFELIDDARSGFLGRIGRSRRAHPGPDQATLAREAGRQAAPAPPGGPRRTATDREAADREAVEGAGRARARRGRR